MDGDYAMRIMKIYINSEKCKWIMVAAWCGIFQSAKVEYGIGSIVELMVMKNTVSTGCCGCKRFAQFGGIGQPSISLRRTHRGVATWGGRSQITPKTLGAPCSQQPIFLIDFEKYFDVFCGASENQSKKVFNRSFG